MLHALLDPAFLIQSVGLLGVFVMVFVESGFFFGFFFPGDSLLFTAGLLASQGLFSFPILVIGCVAAATLGSAFGYFFGNQVGPAIFSREDSFFFHKKHVDETRRYYDRHGKKTIILARFIPIVRTFAPILAGVGRMRYRTFALYNFLGSVAWSLCLPGIGYFLGALVPGIQRYLLPVVLIIIVVSFIPSIAQFLRRRAR